ncbi:YaeQ family protein [Thauera linaloolentis]|uniref:YaeQ family protein n=1 Tax=Thauera linaloolentis (strain DSM 12138 / JCM 21573 / CCUG 41526 / CIP 105981 / IAM 15112 / NBRC 102519 / 47Lol) TaxID=1123367 RepID=N6YG86_THAL4|nr:YaeQ family protein [Thauera linaloolentis]ENO90520.1 YaeQ family protein [Thauera linaloolentis 47Lol = DSM 12138]MCM8566379.1 YaeQ family protein [Thauera linaloolentis]
MALKATIFKAEIQIADMDRGHYADYSLTLARHPSETDERMMVRLLAFALFADPALGFGKGLCADDEPDLWQKDLTGAIERWIDVGQPDEKWVRKACGRAGKVVVLAYGRALDVWWNGVREKLARQSSLQVIELARESSSELARLAERTMRLQFSIQDGHVWVTNGQDTVQIQPGWLQGADRA